MGHVADVCRPTPHDDPRSYGEGDSEVKATRPEAAQFPKRQRVGSWSPAGSSPEPVRPEMAGKTPQGPASTIRSTKLSRRSWDFDEDEQDFGEKKNPPKPHASP
jgi:hypothetical protein